MIVYNWHEADFNILSQCDLRGKASNIVLQPTQYSLFLFLNDDGANRNDFKVLDSAIEQDNASSFAVQ